MIRGTKTSKTDPLGIKMLINRIMQTYQVKGFINFSQVGVSQYLIANRVVAIPNTVQVICHEIDPVDIFDHICQVKVA